MSPANFKPVKKYKYRNLSCAPIKNITTFAEKCNALTVPQSLSHS